MMDKIRHHPLDLQDSFHSSLCKSPEPVYFQTDFGKHTPDAGYVISFFPVLYSLVRAERLERACLPYKFGSGCPTSFHFGGIEDKKPVFLPLYEEKEDLEVLL